jgi:hypothetical protein
MSDMSGPDSPGSFYDPYADAVLEDPAPVYARLRREAPVLHLERYDAWFLARFEEIWQATQSPKLSVARGITPSNLLLGQPALDRMPSQMDPPRHTEVRALVGPHFRPAAARELEPAMRRVAASLLDELVPRGSFDAVRDFGARLASRVACLLTGLPAEDADRLCHWVNGFFHRRPGHRGETEVAARVGAELHDYVAGFVRAARRDPARASGVAHTLLTRTPGTRPMDDEDVTAALVNFQIAASDSFPKALAATLHRLWQHPDQRRRVAADPALCADAFHEAVRFDTPTQFQGRTVVEELAIGPHRLRPGQKLCFLFASANRDEREFAEPDRFDVLRRPRRMLGFGNGIHLCLGMHVARAEARVALEELLGRVPDYAVREAEAERARTEYVQGWLRLPIEF